MFSFEFVHGEIAMELLASLGDGNLIVGILCGAGGLLLGWHIPQPAWIKNLLGG